MDMNQPHELAALIDKTRQVNGWSDQDIVNRATSAGHKLSKANISRVRNSPVVAVNIGFVNAMSAGMGVPAEMITRAALAAAGIIMDADNITVEDAISRDMTLSLDNKQTLHMMVRAMRETSNNGTEQKTKPAPDTQPDNKKTMDLPDPTGNQENGSTHDAHDQKTDTPGTPPAMEHWPDFMTSHDIGPPRTLQGVPMNEEQE